MDVATLEFGNIPCGKPIIVEVIGEEDVVDLFNEIQTKRNEIHKKYMRTDSKKKEHQYGYIEEEYG